VKQGDHDEGNSAVTKILTLDEMQEALHLAGHPQAGDFARKLEAVGDEMAAIIRETSGITSGQATCAGTAFGGTSVGFNPAKAGDQLPEIIAAYDVDGEWEPYTGTMRPLLAADQT
jgi:hypothetical protein